MSSTLYSSGTVVSSDWLNDADTATYNYLTAVVGTNAITATGPVSMLSYTAGDRFYLKPTATNTGATTINISGLGVQPITKNGSTNLVAGDLVVGNVYEIVYDGTLFQVLNPSTFNLNQVIPVTNGGTGATTAAQALINLGATGRLAAVQTFTANGTYTPTAGTTRVVVEVIGGGGGGGGAAATGGGQVSTGSGGSSGGYTKALLISPGSQPITVGAAGVGNVGTAGGNGGTSSFGASVTALGGTGGLTGAAGAVAGVDGVAGAVAGVGGNIFAIPGSGSDPSLISATLGGFSGGGGDGPLGGRARGQDVGLTGKTGIAATGMYGSGGGGAANNASQAARAGGAGATGIVIVYEYF